MKDAPLRADDIIVLYDRCFRVERIMVDEDGDPLVVAECLEKSKREQTVWWHFPVDGLEGLREFADSTRRIIN